MSEDLTPFLWTSPWLIIEDFKLKEYEDKRFCSITFRLEMPFKKWNRETRQREDEVYSIKYYDVAFWDGGEELYRQIEQGGGAGSRVRLACAPRMSKPYEVKDSGRVIKDDRGQPITRSKLEFAYARVVEFESIAPQDLSEPASDDLDFDL